MPELPEVETVRRGISTWVQDATIETVSVHHPRAIRRHVTGSTDFRDRLKGATITGTHRRGKYLWLTLDSGDSLICHLGMSGQLLIKSREQPKEKHLRICIQITGSAQELRFVDQRTFGEMFISPNGGDSPKELGHIGLDVYDDAFDITAASTALRQRRTELKRALLDQTLISGIGNIYADETLWRIKLPGTFPTEQLTEKQSRELIHHVRDVFDDALAEGGTSFDALYVNVNGESGYFDRSLHVYGREGQPCHRCKALILREKFTNRSSFRCPRCQKNPPSK